MTFPVRRYRRIAAALLPLALFALAGCGTQFAKDQQIQDDLQAAMQQAQVGKTQEARQWADRAVAVAPQNINTYLNIPTNTDDTDRLSLVDINGGDSGVFTSVGDDASVIFYMTKAVTKFPDNFYPLQALEDAQGRTGDTAAQRATAARLAALIERQLRTPGHETGPDLEIRLAQAYWDAGDPVKGAAAYRRVIAIYPGDKAVQSSAENGLAYAYAVANDTTHLPEALTLAQASLKLAQADGEDDQAQGAISDTVGWVQYRLGDYKNALINVQDGVSASPRLAEGRYHLAMVYKALGDTEAARTEFGYAVHLSQDYADAKRELASLPPQAGTQSGGSA